MSKLSPPPPRNLTKFVVALKRDGVVATHPSGLRTGSLTRYDLFITDNP